MIGTEHYVRKPVTVPAAATAREAAERMRAEGVAALVVVDGPAPVGIVTDRDLLRRVIGAEGGSASMTVRDVMSAPLVTATSEEPLAKLLERMAGHGIRRLPILRGSELAGIVGLDDLASSLSSALSDAAAGARRETRAAQLADRQRALAADVEGRVRDAVKQIEKLGEGARKGLMDQLEGLRERLRGDGS